MKKVEMLHDSLEFAFDVLEAVTADLTQEQADWLPPGCANSIGVLYWHTIAYVDQIVHEWCMEPFMDVVFEEWFAARCAGQYVGMGQEPLRITGGWQDKVVVSFPPKNPNDPYWEVRAVREGYQLDLPALRDYARATRETLLERVASLTNEAMERSLPTPIGYYFMDLLLEVFIIGHINSHAGEISALRGCLGLQGYPW